MFASPNMFCTFVYANDATVLRAGPASNRSHLAKLRKQGSDPGSGPVRREQKRIDRLKRSIGHWTAHPQIEQLRAEWERCTY